MLPSIGHLDVNIFKHYIFTNIYEIKRNSLISGDKPEIHFWLGRYQYVNKPKVNQIIVKSNGGIFVILFHNEDFYLILFHLKDKKLTTACRPNGW